MVKAGQLLALGCSATALVLHHDPCETYIARGISADLNNARLGREDDVIVNILIYFVAASCQ